MWTASAKQGRIYNLDNLKFELETLEKLANDVKSIVLFPEVGTVYFAAKFNANLPFMDKFRLSNNEVKFAEYRNNAYRSLDELINWHNNSLVGKEIYDPNAYVEWLKSYKIDYRIARWKITADCTVAKYEEQSPVDSSIFDSPENDNYCELLDLSNFKESYWCAGYAESVYIQNCEG